MNNYAESEYVSKMRGFQKKSCETVSVYLELVRETDLHIFPRLYPDPRAPIQGWLRKSCRTWKVVEKTMFFFGLPSGFGQNHGTKVGKSNHLLVYMPD